MCLFQTLYKCKEQYMDKKCINCRHYRQGSVGPTRKEYIWGDCLKSKKHAGEGEDSGSKADFTWADGFCGNFEPKETTENRSRESDCRETFSARG